MTAGTAATITLHSRDTNGQAVSVADALFVVSGRQGGLRNSFAFASSTGTIANSEMILTKSGAFSLSVFGLSGDSLSLF